MPSASIMQEYFTNAIRKYYAGVFSVTRSTVVYSDHCLDDQYVQKEKGERRQACTAFRI